jgi:hypothetical protein
MPSASSSASAPLAGSLVSEETREFYRRVLRILDAAGVPFLVGGAWAFARHTGIDRATKDFDIFVRRADRDRTLEALAAEGFRTDITFPHWLAKAFSGDDFVDVIYSSGNGVSRVDDEWFMHAVDGEIFGVRARLVASEEMLWQKTFVRDRERFDGADVMHLLRAGANAFDWPRLLRRFGSHWRVLYSDLILFGFVYPAERDRIPTSVMRELGERLARELADGATDERVCQGTVLSRAQYLVDIERWGYADARLEPLGGMSAADIAHWTAAIGRDAK